MSQTEIDQTGKDASEAIGKLLSKGQDFIVVQSAGNAGIDSVNNGTFSTISYNNCATFSNVSKEDIIGRVLIVSAVGSDGNMTSFSCGGESGTNAIAAPGLDIFSCGLSNDTYAYMSGTSMAAPVVTAVCGLTWAANPGNTGAEVVSLVMNSTSGIAQTNSASSTTGGMGIINAKNAVEAAIDTLPTYYGQVVNAVNGYGIDGAAIKIHKGGASGAVVATTIIANDGDFSLPKLPAGTYTLEMTADGYAPASFTFSAENKTYYDSLGALAMSPVMDEGEYRIVLRWGEEPSDLDSHLVATTRDGDPYHVYYMEMQPNPGYAYLDVDDTSSYGPETVTIGKLSDLRNVRYAVHDYTNRDSYESTEMARSGAYVTVYRGSEVVAEFHVPYSGGTEWDVFAFDANGNIVPMNRMTYCENPSAVLGGDGASAFSVDYDKKAQ